MVQIPRAEDDPALTAAVGVDGVKGLANLLVKRSLWRQQWERGVNMFKCWSEIVCQFGQTNAGTLV